MKVAFVCKHGQSRSAYAATRLHELRPDISTTYFGVSGDESTLEQAAHLVGVDRVYVMEPSFESDIRHMSRFMDEPYVGQVDCLDVPDDESATGKINSALEELAKKL